MPIAQYCEAGSSGDFPEGKIVAKILDGKELIFIRRQGKVQCYEDQCTHQPVKLSEFGEVMGGRLVCHAHGGTFDLDKEGAVICNPPFDALKSYVCEESGGKVAAYL